MEVTVVAIYEIWYRLRGGGAVAVDYSATLNLKHHTPEALPGVQDSQSGLAEHL